MASILIRTLLIYILLFLSLRIMGKRQIGELDVGDLISTLLISELAAIPIDDPDIPLMNAILPTLVIISIEIILSTLKNKSERLKRAVEGAPVYIIYKGRLLQEALRKNRLSVNEVLSALRSQGAADISEVEYALVEQNGTLSIAKTGETPMAHAIIVDGARQNEVIRWLGVTDKEIRRALSGRDEGDVFLMTATDEKKINVIMREI